MLVNIVGGSGFVGTRLAKRLVSAGMDVSILDKVLSRAFPQLTQICDVRSQDSLSQSVASEAILINLAAEHRDDVRPLSLYDEVNVDGARNVCAVAREKSVRTIVFTSSVAIYGFAPIGTDETGTIAPFNDYGRTKYAAEQIYKAWQAELPGERALVIIRPTVIFGEQNRGNVYNLLKQIASGRFLMVGDGRNRKSIAYVENVASFIQYSMGFAPGLHVYNYIDKPDFSMNEFVSIIYRILGKEKTARAKVRLPYFAGYLFGSAFDVVSRLTGKRFAISAIRVKKFCADSVYNTAIAATGFSPPVDLGVALENTITYEFLESHEAEGVFYSE